MIGRSRGVIAAWLGATVMLAACRGTKKTAGGDVSANGRHEAGSLEGVTGSGPAGQLWMLPSAPSRGAQAALETGMRAMTGARGDQLQAMMPQHRQLVTTMIAQMNAEMGSGNTGGSAGWMATRDSVNQDLMRFPNMSVRDIQAMLPGHEARVNRLMQMHRGSMGSMGRMMPNR